jgi:hypothetical protein
MPALLERHAVLQSPSRIEEIVEIFIHATNVSFFYLSLAMGYYAHEKTDLW